MKIIIMTGRFGMGHLAAAQAIKQQIENKDKTADVEIIDWLMYVSPRYADKIYQLFTVIASKGGRLYNDWYLFMENRKTNKKPELGTYFLWCFAKFIEDMKPDLIISTLPLCSQIASHYMDKRSSSIPLITCVTDITGHSEWICKNTTFYLVGSQSVKDKFMRKGVSEDQILVTGIPVKVEFDIAPSDNRAFPMNKPTKLHDSSLTYQMKGCSSRKKLLIMGGGLGILPEDISFYIGINQLPKVTVTIITGRNERLYHRLRGKFEHLNVLGYVNNVCDYMKWADVIITKPGGVTIFEAIHATLPILALNPYLQQEIYNADFIRKMHIGSVVSGNSEQCISAIWEFIQDGKLEFYQQNIHRFKNQLGENGKDQMIAYAIKDIGNRYYEGIYCEQIRIGKNSGINEKNCRFGEKNIGINEKISSIKEMNSEVYEKIDENKEKNSGINEKISFNV